jgi:2-keto-4-pentenoate hydratase/2-oxohepta-3-ene-1,7-dioic acid hydratase in catechol pathway
VGLNYRDHAAEVRLPVPEEPILFLKPPSSVIGPGEPILLPPQSDRVDYEAELAVVIGKVARNVPMERAGDYVFGYTCLNDVTARDLQKKDGQWTRSKSFDTFCPIGPWVETEVDPSDLPIELYLNGECRQRSRTSELIFGPLFLVEFVSKVMTLQPGDIIATGTTSGIGPMKVGDKVEVRIDGIGSLINPVQRSAS